MAHRLRRFASMKMAMGLLVAPLFFGEAAPANAAVVCSAATCLRATDINGIHLDMTVAEVSRIFAGELESIGAGQFKAERDGTSYDFGFTPLGHLFRIDSSQELGRFEPDTAAAIALTQKLSQKYGMAQSNQLPGGPASWEFMEYYENDGFRLLRFTESLDAMFVTHYQDSTTLDLKLMDFRILRRDEAKQNSGPSGVAQAQMHF